MEELRDQILRVSFGRFNGKFAGGDEANNKLDLEQLQYIPDLRQKVASGVADLAKPYRPSLIIPIPNGANWLGGEVADLCGVKSLELRKDPETKEISLKDDESRITCMEAEEIVLVEDAITRFTSTRRALAIPHIAERAVAVVAIWNRGHFDERLGLGIDHHALVDEYIPPMLPKDSLLWDFTDE
jgi:hypothetical protein